MNKISKYVSDFSSTYSILLIMPLYCIDKEDKYVATQNWDVLYTPYNRLH